MLALADKVAVVKGVGSGIGKATAQLFAVEGAQIISWDIEADSAARTVASLNGPHPGSSRILDATDAPQVASAKDTMVSDYGRLDVLVNVAGGSGRKWGDGRGCHHVGSGARNPRPGWCGDTLRDDPWY